jgi:uncharacterized membrane protein
MREKLMTNNATPTGGFDMNRPTIIALLYLAGWITGYITGIVGGVLAFVWKGEAHEPWEGTHYQYQINTFWIAVATSAIGIILTVTIIFSFIGIPLLFAGAIWTTVRSVMSLINAQKREPMPNPLSWGI